MTNLKRIVAAAIIVTAVISGGTAEARAAGPTVLVNQMGGIEATPGWDPMSLHKPDGTEVQSAADDFTVPNRRTWTLTSVEVGGSRITQSTTGAILNEQTKFDVTVFRTDPSTGGPGAAVAPTVRTLPTSTSCCIDSDGFLLALPNIVVTSGKYWISVAAVRDPLLDGTWYWRGYTSQNGSVARYHSPNSNGWQSLTYPHDLELRLTGTSASTR